MEDFFSDVLNYYNDLLNPLGTKNPTLSNGHLYANKIEVNESAKVYIFGDFHSSISSLRKILCKLIQNKVINDRFKIIGDNNYLIFLGDLVDRGPYSLELLSIVLQLKLINKNNVYIINGNHEDFNTYNRYGFMIELNNEVKNKVKLRNNIMTTLSCLPIAIFLKFGKGKDKYYQLCHGGIEPKYNPKYDLLNDSNIFILNHRNENGPIINPPDYDGHGLKWSDFDMSEQVSRNSDRGAGYVYGYSATEKYLENNNLKAIISGHQDMTPLGLLIGKNDDKHLAQKNLTFTRYFTKNYPKNPLAHKNLTLTGYFTTNHPEKPFYRKTLYVPSKNMVNTNNYEIDLIPGEDFIALTTSTAIESKYLKHHCYLELNKDELKVHLLKNELNKIKKSLDKLPVTDDSCA